MRPYCVPAVPTVPSTEPAESIWRGFGYLRGTACTMGTAGTTGTRALAAAPRSGRFKDIAGARLVQASDDCLSPLARPSLPSTWSPHTPALPLLVQCSSAAAPAAKDGPRGPTVVSGGELRHSSRR